jgi:acetyl esterase/lipase
MKSAAPEVLEGRKLASVGLQGKTAAAEVAPMAATRTLAPAAGVRALANLAYAKVGGQTEHLDLYLPTGPTPPGGRPVVLALPGGGWRWVRRNDLGVTVSELARYGYVVAVADYAFASSTVGSHVWPTNLKDVRQAVRWLKTNGTRFGIDPNRIAVWGESAGAHLANLLATDPDAPLLNPNGATSGQTAAGEVSARVQAVIDFYGPTDLAALYQQAPRDRPFLKTFLGGTPAQYPSQYRDASPVSHVTPSAPPFLIYQGTADTANVPSQTNELDQALTRAGVPHHVTYFQGVPHGFRLQPLPGVNLLPQILAFLDASLNHPSARTR